jgi:hypothetical protein
MTAVKIDKISSAVISGDQTKRPTRPLTYLPARLDAEACLKVLELIDPEAKTSDIAAARKSVNVASLDSALEYTSLSISDKFRLKAALSEHGILAVGRKI